MNSDYFFVHYYTCRSLVVGPSTHSCDQKWPPSTSFISTSYQHVAKVVVLPRYMSLADKDMYVTFLFVQEVVQYIQKCAGKS
jgi:hypothetical protein